MICTIHSSPHGLQSKHLTLLFHHTIYPTLLKRSWYHLSCCNPCHPNDAETFLMDDVADNTNGRLLRSRKHFSNILAQITNTHSSTKRALAASMTKDTKKNQEPSRKSGCKKSDSGKVSVKKATSKKQAKVTKKNKADVALLRKFAALCAEKPHAVAHACNKYQTMAKAQLLSELRRNNVNVSGSKDYLMMRAICMMRVRRVR